MKNEYSFSLIITYPDKLSIERVNKFNCSKVSYAWGAAKRWANKEAEKNNSTSWELSIGR